MKAKEDVEKAGCGRNCDGWLEKGSWDLPINVEFWR